MDESVPGEGGRKIMGLLAQEVREVIPNAVVETVRQSSNTAPSYLLMRGGAAVGPYLVT